MDPRLAGALKVVVPAAGIALPLVGAAGRKVIALAAGIGVVAVFAVLRDWSLPLLPEAWWHALGGGEPWALFRSPGDGMQLLLWSLLLLGIVGTLWDANWLPRGVPAVLGFLLAAALPFLTVIRLHGRTLGIAGTWDATTGALHVAAGTAAVLACWLLTRVSNARRGGIAQAVAWTAFLGVDALVLLDAGSAMQGQLAGAFSASLGAALVTAAWRRPLVLGEGAVMVFAVGHAGMLFAGHELGELPVWPGLAALLAPCSLWLLVARPLQARPALGWVVAAAAGAALAGYAIVATGPIGGGI